MVLSVEESRPKSYLHATHSKRSLYNGGTLLNEPTINTQMFIQHVCGYDTSLLATLWKFIGDEVGKSRDDLCNFNHPYPCLRTFQYCYPYFPEQVFVIIVIHTCLHAFLGGNFYNLGYKR